MNSVTKILAIREGGAVERFHTVPHVGTAAVGMHAYNATSMLLVLNPNPSMRLVKAVLWHDSAERWVGDSPGSIKWRNPMLKEAVDTAEAEYAEKMGIGPIELSDDEELWLKEMDVLELLFYCLDQEAFGNQHLGPTIRDCWEWFGKHKHEMHTPVINVFDTATWRRLTHEEMDRGPEVKPLVITITQAGSAPSDPGAYLHCSETTGCRCARCAERVDWR